jgi:arabinan endo-1,5-alpha-L-arabinosidase
VRHTRGGYTLMFSGSPANGGQNCIGEATSTDPAGPFVPVTGGTFEHGLCSHASNTAYLDPSLFRAPDRTLWLFYSAQTYGPVGTDPAGAIHAQQLTSDAANTVAKPTLLLTFDEVASNIATCDLGSFPRLENPAMVAEPSGNFRLFMSLGSYNNPCYSTVEVPCLAMSANCSPQDGSVVALSGSTDVVGTGGASLYLDSVSKRERIVFHGFIEPWNGVRFPFWNTVSQFGSAHAPIPTRAPPPVTVGTRDLGTTPNRYDEPTAAS